MMSRLALVCACMLAALALCTAQPTILPYSGDDNPYPQAADDDSFCHRLASKNGYNYTDPDHLYALMYRFVQRAYHGAAVNGSVFPPVLYEVQGLKVNPNTIRFFDGTLRYRDDPASPYHGQPTPDMKTDAAAAHALDDKIARWMGKGFGCAGAEAGEGFLGKYPYLGSMDMPAVHKGMGITQREFAAFINQFESSAFSLGATAADFDLKVRPYLQSFGRGAGLNTICAHSDCVCATGRAGDACDQAAPNPDTTVDPGEGPKPADLTGTAPASLRGLGAGLALGLLAVLALLQL